MKVLYFGFYDPGYARNRVLIKGLKANDVEVLECRDSSRGFKKFLNLYKKHKIFKNQYDAVIVGFLGHIVVPLVKLISGKPVIFDAFVSLYESNVEDRKLFSRYSLRAWYYWFLDWLSMSLANLVLFDTDEHINYVVEEFGLKKNKVKRIFVGTDETIFYPRKKETSQVFTVHFHGSFIPLQGVDCIIKAAKLLEKENIQFNILGDGQTYSEVRKLVRTLNLKNINFINRVEYDKLPEHIKRGDICLGVFGKSSKNSRVIPNKVYEYAAMKKPIITADTPAIRELFSATDMLFIDSSPENLASAILKLKNNQKLRESLAENAYAVFSRFGRPETLGRELKQIAEELIR